MRLMLKSPKFKLGRRGMLAVTLGPRTTFFLQRMAGPCVGQWLAGIIRKALSEEKRVSTKTSAVDLVTETDQAVEALILSELQERFPSHRFIAEEAAAAGAKCVLTPSPTWIVDPIDGTCNFVHRFPTVAVSIGFAVNQELEFGVIYHCTEERLYTGQRGRGAFCNGQQLQVSRETDLSKALVLTEIGPRRDPATLKLFLSNMERLLRTGAHGYMHASTQGPGWG